MIESNGSGSVKSMVLFIVFLLSCFSFLAFSISESILLPYFFLFYVSILLFRILFSHALQKAIMELQALHYVKNKRQMYHLSIRISFVIMLVFFFLFHGILLLFSLTTNEKILSFLFSLSFFLFPVIDCYRSYFLGHAKNQYVKTSYFITGIFILLAIVVWTIVSLFVRIPTLNYAYFSVFLYLAGYLLFGISLLYWDKKYQLFLEKVTKSAVIEQKLVPIQLLQSKLADEKKFFMLIPILFFLLFDFIVMKDTLVSTFHYQVKDSYQIISIMICFLNSFLFCFLLICFSLLRRKKIRFPKNLNSAKEIRSYFSHSTSFLFSILLFVSLLGSFLSFPLWNFVYGDSSFGAIYFSVFSFLTLFIGLFLHFSSVLYEIGERKRIRNAILVMILFKVLFTYSFMLAMRRMVLPVVIGNMVSSIVSYLLAIIMMGSFLVRRFKLDLDEILKNGIEIVGQNFVVIIVLFILTFVVPIDVKNRFLSLFVLTFYSFVAILFYFFFRKKIRKT